MQYIDGPLTGREVSRLSGTRRVLTYSEVVNALNNGYYFTDLLDPRTHSLIVLYEWKPGIGHWVGVKLAPEEKEAYFFSSYGNKPDAELGKYLSTEQRRASNQSPNVINDFLKKLYLAGWVIYYNDFPFQREGDGTATCGRWLAKYLQSDMNPDEFAEHYLGRM